MLREVSAELTPGNVIEVVGVNGAGKSTLLRLLAGVTRPSSGTITGRPAVVGYAPDRFPIEQPFTVASYLRHMSRVRGGARWEPWTERLNMSALLDVRLRELSKGSAHKVGLAQALMADPGLLILDEPFAGLDADTRAALPGIIADLSSDGTMVIASDHQGVLRDQASVRRWSVIDGRVKEGTASLGAERPTQASTALASAASPPSKRTVQVTLPAEELQPFLDRMRDEGYQAREIGGTR